MPLYDAYGRPLPAKDRDQEHSGIERKGTQVIALIKSFGGWFLAICTVLSALIFWPRVVVSSDSATSNQAEQFVGSFDITNTGITRLENVSAWLEPGFIRVVKKTAAPEGTPTSTKKHAIPNRGSAVTQTNWLNHSLGMDERFTIGLEEMFKIAEDSKVEEADIAILVKYQPWVLPIHLEKAFRFVLYESGDGKLRWKSWPMNEPIPLRTH